MRGYVSSSTGRCLVALAMSVSFAGGCWGQARNIQRITRIRLKSDRVLDFEALVQQFNAELKRTGEKRQATWWTSTTGPTEVLLVRWFKKFADLDSWPSPANASPILSSMGVQLRGCALSAETTYLQILPDLSLPGTPDIPKMVRVLRTTVRPDKVDAYKALIKEELLPAIRKSGVKTFFYAQTQLGRPSNEMMSALGIDKWADLDEDIATEAMGADAFQRFLSRRNELILNSQMDVYRSGPS